MGYNCLRDKKKEIKMKTSECIENEVGGGTSNIGGGTKSIGYGAGSSKEGEGYGI